MTQPYDGALVTVDGILTRGGDADDVLRKVLDVLEGLYPYVAIAFVEEGDLVVGPEAGSPAVVTESFPIAYEGTKVAELRVAGTRGDDGAFLERVATLISPHCLVGWDTGGEAWEP